ncbi:hypothetical protein ES703_83431 [subsurface metagenome]
METCTSCPAPNDDKSISFDYTPTFAEASDGKQDRFGAGQAGQAHSATLRASPFGYAQGRPIRLRSGQALMRNPLVGKVCVD